MCIHIHMYIHMYIHIHIHIHMYIHIHMHIHMYIHIHIHIHIHIGIYYNDTSKRKHFIDYNDSEKLQKFIAPIVCEQYKNDLCTPFLFSDLILIEEDGFFASDTRVGEWVFNFIYYIIGEYTSLSDLTWNRTLATTIAHKYILQSTQNLIKENPQYTYAYGTNNPLTGIHIHIIHIYIYIYTYTYIHIYIK